jgi:hypothetical protein
MFSEKYASRDIDDEAGRSYSWLGERFRLIKTQRVGMLVALLIIVFFAGACSSIVWLNALDVFVYNTP